MTTDQIRALSDSERAAVSAAVELESAFLNLDKARAEAAQADLAAKKAELELKQDGSRWQVAWKAITQIIQVLVGVGGLVGGYLAAQVEYGSKKAAAEEMHRKAEDKYKEAEGKLAAVEAKERAFEDQKELKQRELQAAKGMRDVAEEQRTLIQEKAAMEKQKIDADLAGLKREVAEADALKREKKAEAEDAKSVSDGLRLQIAQLKAEMEKVGQLASQKKNEQAAKVATAVTAPAPTVDMAAPALRAEVEKLFDPSAKNRGDAYARLTSKELRTERELPTALVQVGTEQLTRYRTLAATPNAPEAQLLRRGLENVVVTLRDISRSVTQLEGTKQAIQSFAREVSALDYGVGQEATSLLNWLETQR